MLVEEFDVLSSNFMIIVCLLSNSFSKAVTVLIGKCLDARASMMEASCDESVVEFFSLEQSIATEIQEIKNDKWAV